MSKQIAIIPEVKQGLALTITDKKTMELASDMRSKAKKFLKQLTDDKEKVTKPLNEALKQERARFKPFEDQANMVIKHLDKEMTRYQTAEDEKAEAERAKIAARIGEGKGKLKVETALNKFEQIDTPDTVVGNTQFVTDYEVILPDDIMTLPVEFLKVEVRLADLKKALKDGVEVPGASLKTVKKPRAI